MRGSVVFVRTSDSPLQFAVAEDLAEIKGRVALAVAAARASFLSFVELTCTHGPSPSRLYLRVDEILAIEEQHV